jgi:hypothetical protein
MKLPLPEVTVESVTNTVKDSINSFFDYPVFANSPAESTTVADTAADGSEEETALANADAIESNDNESDDPVQIRGSELLKKILEESEQQDMAKSTLPVTASAPVRTRGMRNKSRSTPAQTLMAETSISVPSPASFQNDNENVWDAEDTFPVMTPAFFVETDTFSGSSSDTSFDDEF